MKRMLFLIGVIFLAACSPTVTPMPSPLETSFSTSTPTPTQTPASTPTITPTLSPIMLENVSNVTQLARLGQGAFGQVAWSPNGKTLAVASSMGVYLYDADRLSELQFIDTGVWMTTVAFSPDGHILASGGQDGIVRLWSTSNGTPLHTLRGHNFTVKNVTFNPDGRILASGGHDGAVQLWDTTTGQLLRALNERRGLFENVIDIAYHPTGQTLAVAVYGEWYHPVQLWDVSTSQILRTFEKNYDPASDIVFSPDGHLLAGCGDGVVRLWAVDTGKSSRVLAGYEANQARRLAFSPDGRILASGDTDGMIGLWNVSTGQFLHALKGHTGWVRSIAFSPDGRILASAGEDGTIRLWGIVKP